MRGEDGGCCASVSSQQKFALGAPARCLRPSYGRTRGEACQGGGRMLSGLLLELPKRYDAAAVTGVLLVPLVPSLWSTMTAKGCSLLEEEATAEGARRTGRRSPTSTRTVSACCCLHRPLLLVGASVASLHGSFSDYLHQPQHCHFCGSFSFFLFFFFLLHGSKSLKEKKREKRKEEELDDYTEGSPPSSFPCSRSAATGTGPGLL